MKLIRFLLCTVAVLVSSLVFAGAAKSQFIYSAAITGSDATGDGSPFAPFATLQTALNAAPSGGNVALLEPGNYGSGNATRSVNVIGFSPLATINGGITGAALTLAPGTYKVENLKITCDSKTGTIGIRSNDALADYRKLLEEGCASGWLVDGGRIIMRESSIQGNNIGIQVNGGKLFSDENTISGNTTSGVQLTNSDAVLEGGQLVANGTGIRSDGTGTVELEHLQIVGNETGVSSGTATAEIDLNNCLLSGNFLAVQGLNIKTFGTNDYSGNFNDGTATGTKALK